MSKPKEDVLYTASPLGIMPRWCWIEHRCEAILDAMCRYAEAEKPVPPEWTQELREHVTWLALRKRT